MTSQIYLLFNRENANATAVKRKDSGMENIANDRMNVRKTHTVGKRACALIQRCANQSH